jgi:hypothetical protein
LFWEKPPVAIEKDEEGVAWARDVGKNMAWILNALQKAKGNS